MLRSESRDVGNVTLDCRSDIAKCPKALSIEIDDIVFDCHKTQCVPIGYRYAYRDSGKFYHLLLHMHLRTRKQMFGRAGRSKDFDRNYRTVTFDSGQRTDTSGKTWYEQVGLR